MHIPRQLTNGIVYFSALIAIVATPVWAQDGDTSADKESELIAVLRSDAPGSEKAITCKLLAIFGSSEAVPELAKLLSDPRLASWARIALEAIPEPAADKALRKATESLDGKLLIGTINSIGVRRDANAVDLLATILKNKGAEAASAAAVALGRIGNESATQSLRESLAAAPVDVRSAVAEGYVLCAERLHREGQANKAVVIYDEIRKANVPKQRIIEATRGAILARNQDGIPLLLEQFKSTDKKFFQLALSTAREFPGGEIDKSLAALMADSAPDRAALIVQAMADRQDTVVLPAVLTAAKQGPKQVRLSAIDALGRVGDASCLSVLLAIAGETDVDLAQAAKETLADLPSEDINIQIVALLRKAKGEQLPLLLALVGQRRINAVATVLEALDHSNKEVRQAALAALGETITFKDLAVLVSQVVGQKNSQDTGAALQALTAASVRMPDREACAAELATAIAETSSVPTKGSLLEILAAVGGTNALKAMGAAAKSSNPELQDISTRLLGKWMTEDAAPVLLDLAKTAPSKKYQVRALRGYIRIARQFVMPPQRRAAMCEQAFEASQQTAEQRLVLEVLKRYPHSATLKVAIKAMEVPELKDEAAQAILVIVQKIGGKGVNVRELLSKTGLAEVKLEILKAEYGAGSTQMDVTAVIRKHAGDLPLITLPTTSYNTSFGRDPLPGNVKQLRIQYRINGKAGTALFAENALILLPLPK